MILFIIIFTILNLISGINLMIDCYNEMNIYCLIVGSFNFTLFGALLVELFVTLVSKYFEKNH